MPVILSNFWASVGFFGVTVAAATGLAYWLFRQFSEKWLTQKFSQRLEDYKHAQQKELERLRFQISSTMDRTVKLHKFEFEVLPKLWEMLNAAYRAVAGLVSPLQSTPDLDQMSLPHLSEFLSKSELADWQQNELLSGDDKTQRYAKMIFWYQFNRVNNVFHDFNDYFIANGIFLTEALKQKIETLRDILSGALREKRFEEQHPSPRPGRFERCELVRTEGSELLPEIEAEVRAVLWQTGPAEKPGETP